jgi:hypothetical protein
LLKILPRLHSGSLAIGFGLRFLSPLGLLCGLVSVASGITLYSKHQGLSQATCSEGYTYLTERRHDVYGFQHLALLFSLPKALSLWSIALFVPQVFFIVYASIGPIGFSMLILLSAWFTLVFQYKLVPASFHWLPRRNTSEGCIELDSVV